MMDKEKRNKLLLRIIGSFFILLGNVCFFAAVWFVGTYGQIGFDAILFTLFTSMNGVEGGLLLNYFLLSLLPALICTAALCVGLYFRPKKQSFFRVRKQEWKIYPLSNKLSAALTALFSMLLISIAAFLVQMPEYVNGLLHNGKLYENEYVDPAQTEINFPKEKRNLVYIILESMETTFLSKELGGGVSNNLIPELHELASNNINFSHNDGVGGAKERNGASWTIASFVSQTSGIPLRLPIGIDGNSYGKYDQFLPGVTSLIDILHDEGYYQTLMVGSDANFGGRYQYYTQHGVDRVYDLFTARKDGIIPEDYYVWWGMEDAYLFEYAKQELAEISQKEEPFAFTMLTVDTHHINGYFCKQCEKTYEQQYENVLSCSSRQVAQFVQWLQTQEFYENTTVIITGDHNTMDAAYISKNVDDDYDRHLYNCFLNTSIEPINMKNRNFSAFDMFPTTLAAIGCDIEGNRVGLGVNLFSDLDTLAEKYGSKDFDKELAKRSNYYNSKFLYGTKNEFVP